MDSLPHRLQRLLLGLVLLLLCVIQVRYTVMTLGEIADPLAELSIPFSVNPVTLKLDAPGQAAAGGARSGDKVIALDGHPVRSYVQGAGLFYQHKPGDRVEVTLQRGNAAPFEVTFVAKSAEHPPLDLLASLWLNIVTPWFCIVFAGLVGFRRTGDPVAYALTALLLCISQLLRADAGPRMGWGPAFTWLVLYVEVFISKVWPVAWLWFALLFPDPRSPYKLLPWTRWVLGIPVLIQGAVVALTTTSTLHGTGPLDALYRLVHVPGAVEFGVFVSLVALGFANLIYKLIRETRLAVRRRLRWMLFGLALGVLPTLLLFASAAILKRDPNTFPAWVVVPAVTSIFFTPLTLAYAVLVDRLFDVGMFLRQGLLASKTVTILRLLLIPALVWVGASFSSKRVALAVAVLAALLISKGTEHLRTWVDRHFFQEAVNTEHLLIELSAEVRRIADPSLLLRTVTERIADALHVSRVVAFLPGAGQWSSGDGAMLLDQPPLVRLREKAEPLVRSDQLLLPIGANGELSGVLSLGPKKSEEPYSQRDIQLLESVANQTGLAIENTRLVMAVAAEAAHRERITSELEIAREVQERLFPKAAPVIAGIDLAGMCKPAQTVGGDYYDFLVMPGGGAGLAIGDVAGKGVPAALLMAGLQASLRGLVLAGICQPAELLSKLNVLIYDATPVNRFATFFYGLYQPATRTLRYSSAGHNPALLLRGGSKEALWLKTRGAGLGLSRRSRYEQAEVELQAGDCLVLYTDGVTEARNMAEEEFGEERLVTAVRSRGEGRAAEMLEAVVGEALAFAGEAPQHDDLTLIVAAVP